eukprot:GFYU01023576.1.p1 GENE.GFYU01023576.1~~GFYU01023576.1.p1  ORF type:complete len:318 (-),score=66.38 GFYU01023576.1:9-908(-)
MSAASLLRRACQRSAGTMTRVMGVAPLATTRTMGPLTLNRVSTRTYMFDSFRRVDKDEKIISGSRCVILDPKNGDAPESVVIMCHGYGANADDLAAIGGIVAEITPDVNARWIFPEAPVSLQHMGFMHNACAWWNIDIEDNIRKFQSGKHQDLYDEVPQGLDDARALVNTIASEQLSELGLGTDKLVWSGFSQGSMLAVDAFMHSKERVGGLIVMSGSPKSMETHKQLDNADLKKGTPVLQSHGYDDPILPFFAAEVLHEFLTDTCGKYDDLVAFPGGHEVPQELFTKMGDLVSKVQKA